MKLYDLEIKILNSIDVIATFQLTIEGYQQFALAPASADEGTWYAPEIAAYFFGISSGHWSVRDLGFGYGGIHFYSEPFPNTISHLWRGIPDSAAWLDDILKLPLFIGETGKGYVPGLAGIDKYQPLRWKVINRAF